MSDPVRGIKAPVHLDYTVTAGKVLSRFLAGVVEGRLLGRRCPQCTKVYIPPKGACPTCAVPCTDEVQVSDAGTLTSFCIVNVPFEGQTMKLPYVYGSVLLDGADLPILHLINGTNGSTSWDGATSSSVEADGEGIHVGGSYNTFSYMDIHDNGQDAFQTGSAIHYITVDHSWLHNARLHPDPAYSSGDVAWNYCSHSDGMQIYNGGVSDHLTFDHNVHGPGLLQGSLLGQALSGGESAQVNYVTITNSLFVDGVNADVMGYATTSPVGWVIDHNTIFVNYPHSSVLGGYNHAINLDGSGHVASNNVIYQGRLTASGVSFSGNCIYNLLGSTPPSGSIVANPQFVTPPANISLSAEANADYTLQSNSPCSGKGSSITSVAQLAGQNSAAPLSTSTPFPSTTSTPGTSATPALTPVSSPTVALVGEGTSVPTATATTVSSSAPTATKTTVNSPTPQPTAASTPVELPASTNTPTTVPSPTFTPTVVPSPTPTNTATVVPSATPGHGKGNGHKPSQASSSTSPQPTATFTPTVLPGTTPPHGNKP